MSSPGYTRFVIDYQHDGQSWALELMATDAADAARRLRSIGCTGQVLGVHVATIPVARPVHRFLRWLGIVS